MSPRQFPAAHWLSARPLHKMANGLIARLLRVLKSLVVSMLRLMFLRFGSLFWENFNMIGLRTYCSLIFVFELSSNSLQNLSKNAIKWTHERPILMQRTKLWPLLLICARLPFMRSMTASPQWLMTYWNYVNLFLSYLASYCTPTLEISPSSYYRASLLSHQISKTLIG